MNENFLKYYILKMTTDCSICFENVGETNLVVTECNHKFHLSCYRLWTKDTCPMCRFNLSGVEANTRTILEKLPKMLQDDATDKTTLVLYLNQVSQGIMDHVNPLYKALILYNTHLLIERFEGDPVDYILENKLYDLLDYYPLDDEEIQIQLVQLDDLKLVKYIKFENNTLYHITRHGSLKLLKYYRDCITNEYYSDKFTTSILQRFNLMGVACTYGQINLLPFLSKYLDVNEPNDWNCTPLFAAIISGSLETVKWLVEHGVDINIQHLCGSSPLYLAIEKGKLSIANYLINKGAIVDASIVRACINFTDDARGGSQMLRRVLSIISKEDFYKPCAKHCPTSKDIPHNPTCKCEAVDCTSVCCFCFDCRYEQDRCMCKCWTPLQGACFRSKFESVLLLLAYDSVNVINQPQEVCVHTEKHLLNPKFKDERFNHFNYTKWEEWVYCNVKKPKDHKCNSDSLSVYSFGGGPCYFSCIYKNEKKLVPICKYILKLIERGGSGLVSYKHQRKILKKMLKDVPGGSFSWA